MKSGIERDCGMTAEQMYQESMLADSYRERGNANDLRMANVIERRLEEQKISVPPTEMKAGEEVEPKPIH